MKSNPHVYPYTPFRYLSKPEPTSRFVGTKVVSIAAVRRLLVKSPGPGIHPRGGSVAQRVLSIFLDSDIRFGPREYITSCVREWLEKIEHFTAQGKPIQFTILGFPFKTPVPLKTNRRFPDLGDVLALQRLYHIMELVRHVYRPGGIVTVFAESPFAPFANVSAAEATAYRQRLIELASLFGYSRSVRVVNLGTLERLIPGFGRECARRVAEYRRSYRAQNPDFMTKVESAFSSVYRIMNARRYPTADLAAVYSERSDHELTTPQRGIRRTLTQLTTEALFSYFAYLKVRDDFNLLERYHPGALSLTVSPKPHRLGIFPISQSVTVLHTHGVPVYDQQRKTFTIAYLFDLERSGRRYQQVFLDHDKEDKPFYYVQLKGR